MGDAVKKLPKGDIHSPFPKKELSIPDFANSISFCNSSRVFPKSTAENFESKFFEFSKFL